MINVVRDISHHNTINDYGSFRANAESVQIKITESTDFVDDAGQWHHDNCQGIRRAPYHFARPISIPQQMTHFLARKAAIGQWERPDMLDCEFPGITGAFIRALKDEYRRQSGIQLVQIYIGLHDVVTTCPPSQWWDQDVYMQVARYRKIGAPSNPDAWNTHLGFDHIGLSTYQWDNATPFYPGGPAGDVSYDRVPVITGGTMADSDTVVAQAWRLLATLRMRYKVDLPGAAPAEIVGEDIWITRAIDDMAWRLLSLLELKETTQGGWNKSEGNVEPLPYVKAFNELVSDVKTMKSDVEAIKTMLSQLIGAGAVVVGEGAISIKIK